MKVYRMNIRIYYEDTDLGGVVYYANYLRYMERGRTELFREHGINLNDYHKKGLLFGVVDVHIRYKASARYNDLLAVETSLLEVKPASLTFDTKIYNQDRVLLITSETKLACINQKRRACRIPAEIIETLKSE